MEFFYLFVPFALVGLFITYKLLKKGVKMMSKEIVKKLVEVENALLKSIEGKEPYDRIEKTIYLIERIAHIKHIENEMTL